jgi:hypothetical protein
VIKFFGGVLVRRTIMKPSLSAATLIASVFALSTISFGANAASVSVVSDVQNAGVNATVDIVPPVPTISTPVVQFVSGSVSGQYRSPFEGNINGLTNGTYLSIEGTPVTGTATYIMKSAANLLYILWGSVDDYNGITFSNANTGGSDTVTIYGSALNPAQKGLGADFVQLSTDFLFTEVTFFNNPGINAFELSNLTACFGVPNSVCQSFQTEAPLPGTLPLFVSGIAGLGGLLGWRRKKKNALLNAVPA